MRRARVIVLAMALLAAAAAAALLLVYIPEEAVLGSVEGEVLVQSGGRGAFAPAAAGARLRAGDLLRTGPHSGARLDLSPGDRLTLQEQTEIALLGLGRRPLSDRRRTVIEVRLGRVAATIDSGRRRLDLLSPGGVLAAIRGTVLRQAVGGAGGTRLSVDAGSVGLSARRNEVEVGAGFGSAVQPGSAPLPPRPLLAGPEAILRQGENPWEPAYYRFRWPPRAGASAYRTEVSRSEDFSILVDEAESGEPAYDPAGLPDPGAYHLRVRALDDAAIEGSAAATLSFEFDPDFVLGLRDLAAGNAAAAAARLERAAERAPRDSLRWAELGWARHLQGDWGGAVQALSTSLDLDPSPTRVRVRYARDLYWVGDLAGSRQAFREVLAANPTDADAWAGLAAVARVEGKFGEAIDSARKALALNPAHEYAAAEIRRAAAGQRDP